MSVDDVLVSVFCCLVGLLVLLGIWMGLRVVLVTFVLGCGLAFVGSVLSSTVFIVVREGPLFWREPIAGHLSGIPAYGGVREGSGGAER